MSPLRVLHVIPSLDLAHGGPSRAIRLMAKALQQQGAIVHIATTDDAGPKRRCTPEARHALIAEGAGHWHVFPKRSEFYKVSPGLARWLRQHVADYDVVHLHALFSFSSLAAAWAARIAAVPYIVRPLGTLTTYGVTQRRPWLKQLSLRWLEGPMLRHAAAVHFTADAERDEALALGISLQPVVIPLAVEELPPPDPTGLIRQCPTMPIPGYLLFLSRLDPKKNLEALLQAMALLEPQYPDLTLVVVGEGSPAYVAQLKTLAAVLGIAERVCWTGFLDGALKSAVLADASLFVLPSFSENFGIAAAEALQAGLPCVLGEGVAIAAQVQAAGAGRAVAPTPEAVAEAIVFYASDMSRGTDAARQARVLAMSAFSAQAMASSLIKLYRDVIHFGREFR
ncbi:MAG: glycosyltransferase [Pseudomonadota bacterium]